MATRFYFKYDGRNFTESFASTDGEEYVVKLNSPASGYYGDQNLTLEWKEVSSKFITTTTFYENDSATYGSRTAFVKDKTLCTIRNMQIPNGHIVLIVVATCNHLMKSSKPSATKAAGQIVTPTKIQPIVEKKLEQLSTDMKNLLQTGNLSDVVLTDGSKEIHAHKLILSIRSTVFAKMFQHPLKENRENRITIKDITHEVLLQLLHFMYTGTVVIKDSGMARHLYIAADKYDVKDLRNICSTMLKLVDLNSVLDTLLLADLYSDKVLKEAALNFISKNYSQVKAVQKWNSFMKEHQNLAIEILSFVIDKKV